MLSVTNPDSGSATEEIEVEYGSEPLDIGFNSRYLLDIAAQLDGEAAVLEARRSGIADADPGPRHQRRALRADADAGVSGVGRSDDRGRSFDASTILGPHLSVLRPRTSDPLLMPSARIRRLTLTNFRSYHAAQIEVGRRAGGAGWAERRGQDQSHRGDFISRARARPAARDPRRRRVFRGRRVVGGVGRRGGRARTGDAWDRHRSARGRGCRAHRANAASIASRCRRPRHSPIICAWFGWCRPWTDCSTARPRSAGAFSTGWCLRSTPSTCRASMRSNAHCARATACSRMPAPMRIGSMRSSTKPPSLRSR